MSLCASATVLTPGTCGELVQGCIQGSHFLVSCPIDLYSRVTVEISNRFQDVFAPPDSPKSRRALELAMEHFGLDGIGARVTIRSDLPRGKGMASSTADISGVIYATAEALGREISEQEVADICLEIEPTDSSVFSGLALFNHRTGFHFESLGPAPDLDVVILDFGGEVDTLKFNAVNRARAFSGLEGEFERALSLLKEGISEGNGDKIGQAARISALAHQEILPKPELPKIIELADDLGACGVNIAHSGTVIGLLFESYKRVIIASLPHRILELVPTVDTIRHSRMVSGGYSSIRSS